MLEKLIDHEDTIVEGVVVEQAHRFVTIVPSFSFLVPFK
jgi:hypothetical protein